MQADLVIYLSSRLTPKARHFFRALTLSFSPLFLKKTKAFFKFFVPWPVGDPGCCSSSYFYQQHCMQDGSPLPQRGFSLISWLVIRTQYMREGESKGCELLSLVMNTNESFTQVFPTRLQLEREGKLYWTRVVTCCQNLGVHDGLDAGATFCL